MRLLHAARLSAKNRAGNDGLGLETQEERTGDWAEREGHEIVGVVADTRSGTVAPFDRPALKPWVTKPEMMALYDGIVAYKTDRLSRGTQEDFTRIEHWATLHGKALIIVDGPQYPARDDSDYWQWAAEKRQARKEWEAIRERNVRAQQKLRKGGKLVGRPAFGYEVAGTEYDKGLIPSSVGLIIVPAVFAWCKEGLSLARIADRLNAMGAPTMNRETRGWQPNRVAAMIRNPLYRGQRQDASGRTELHVPAIVPSDVWKAANSSLDARPGRGQGKAENAERAMLASVLACPKCSGPMYRINGRGDQVSYRCAGSGAVRKSSCRNMTSLAITDSLVSDFVGSLDSPIMARRTIAGHDHSDEIAKIQYQLEDLPKLGLSEADEDAERARLRQEKRDLEALPCEPARVEWTDTGESYGGAWLALAASERRVWLSERGIGVMAARTDAGTAEAAYRSTAPTQGTAKDLVVGDGVSVVVSWPTTMGTWQMFSARWEDKTAG